MGILDELLDLRDQLAKRSGYPGHLQRILAEQWEKMYWTQVQKYNSFQHQIIRVNGLEKTNQTQAGRIMELELLLSCIHRTGNTVYIDHKKLQRLMRFYPETKRFIKELDEPKGLSSSKYVRTKNE